MIMLEQYKACIRRSSKPAALTVTCVEGGYMSNVRSFCKYVPTFFILYDWFSKLLVFDKHGINGSYSLSWDTVIFIIDNL